MKLTLELVPSSCFYENVRQILSPIQWQTICKMVYAECEYKCSICGGIGEKHPVEAHEIWEYDDENFIQKLKEIVGLCPMCHTTKHFGLARLQGRSEKAIKHFMKVNNLKKNEAREYIAGAFKTWSERSEKKWTLDISILKLYGIDAKEIKKV